MITFQQKVTICICFTVLALTIGLIVGSVQVLNLQKMALNYSVFSLSVSLDKVYTSGRYFLGLGRRFLDFPAEMQIAVFSDDALLEVPLISGYHNLGRPFKYPTIRVRSNDGLPVGIDVVVYYKLGYPESSLPLSQQLYELYKDFGGRYEQLVEMVTIHVLSATAANYTATDFFLKRKEFGDAFKANLRLSLKEDYIYVSSVSMYNIEFPESYAAAVEATEIVNQNISLYKYTVEAQKIIADTRIQNAESQKNMTIELATANAKITKLLKQGIANVIGTSIATKKQAFEAMATNLGLQDDFRFTRGQKMLTYYWIFLQLNNNTEARMKYFSALKTYQLTKIDNV